jgi:hypothetical protein
MHMRISKGDILRRRKLIRKNRVLGVPVAMQPYFRDDIGYLMPFQMRSDLTIESLLNFSSFMTKKDDILHAAEGNFPSNLTSSNLTSSAPGSAGFTMSSTPYAKSETGSRVDEFKSPDIIGRAKMEKEKLADVFKNADLLAGALLKSNSKKNKYLS